MKLSFTQTLRTYRTLWGKKIGLLLHLLVKMGANCAVFLAILPYTTYIEISSTALHKC